MQTKVVKAWGFIFSGLIKLKIGVISLINIENRRGKREEEVHFKVFNRISSRYIAVFI